MILFNGELLDSRRIPEVLDALPGLIDQTLGGPPLEASVVVEACGRLAERLPRHPLVQKLVDDGLITSEQAASAARLLRPESLWHKLHTELGPDPFAPVCCVPPEGGPPIMRRRMPLGVLLHIAAGNAEALPAYTAAEGLLGGNINLIKLPAADDGVSLALLHELAGLQPLLRPYLHVLDTPSSDLDTLERLATLADAIVVWGGEEAVTAVRRFAPPNTRLIEWGHRLSFCYLTPSGLDDRSLAGLAEHIAATNQLLCSSCQGLFLDTERMDEVYGLCERFLPILERACGARSLPLGAQALVTLRRRTRQLEGAPAGERDYVGERCMLTACCDSELVLSPMFGNCWVKPLPRERLVRALHPQKSRLQTAGLVCAAAEREALSVLLLRAGITRVCNAAHMSRAAIGEAHDGEFPLGRYTRITECEKIL